MISCTEYLAVSICFMLVMVGSSSSEVVVSAYGDASLESSPSSSDCSSISDSDQCIASGCCLVTYMKPVGYTRRLMQTTECTSMLEPGETCLRFTKETKYAFELLSRLSPPSLQFARMMCPCQSSSTCDVKKRDIASQCQSPTMAKRDSYEKDKKELFFRPHVSRRF